MPGTLKLQGPKSDDVAIVEDGSEAHRIFAERGWKLLVASEPSVDASGDTKHVDTEKPSSTSRKRQEGN